MTPSAFLLSLNSIYMTHNINQKVVQNRLEMFEVFGKAALMGVMALLLKVIVFCVR